MADGAGMPTTKEDIWSIPLDQLDPSIKERFVDESMWAVFERLRKEDPVHYTAESEFGPYW